MRISICLAVAILVFSCINAQLIESIDSNRDPVHVIRPKRPVPPARLPNSSHEKNQRPPTAGENGSGLNSNSNSFNVHIMTADEDTPQFPPFDQPMGSPFSPPSPPFDQPMGPPSPPFDQPMGSPFLKPPPPPGPPQSRPKPPPNPPPPFDKAMLSSFLPPPPPPGPPKPRPDSQFQPKPQPHPKPEPYPQPNPEYTQLEAMFNRPGQQIADIIGEPKPIYPHRHLREFN